MLNDAVGNLSGYARGSRRIEDRTSRGQGRCPLVPFVRIHTGQLLYPAPLRDTFGTVYGAENLHHLFTATSIAVVIAAPIYAAFASRVKLSLFLPWVYGFFIAVILVFYALFETAAHDRWLAAAFLRLGQRL